MKRIRMAMVTALMFAGATAYAGGDMAAGKGTFEAGCADCHYEGDFAGESMDDIKALIKGVVSGEVDHKGDLSGLSDEEVANLAAYFASFE